MDASLPIAPTRALPVQPVHTDRRARFIIALRAIASLLILWHHFALYPPLRNWAGPLIGGVLDWFEQHARSTQVFFVVGGFVMARSLDHRWWSLPRMRAYIAQRYYRLGIPYLGAIALTMPCYLFARGWLPDAVIGGAVTVPQLIAHLFFMQGILGYEQLSAGLWFVCINFQLGIVLALMHLLRDTLGRGKIDMIAWLGWPFALLSLIYFNRNDALDAWWIYFFHYFFMGVVIYRSLKQGGRRWEFWLYQLAFVVALLTEWRWRLLSAVAVGLVLHHAERTGWGRRWPDNRAVIWLGNVSYSLFLVHFPVLLFVATVWIRQEWTSPPAAVAGLLFAFFLSLVAAGLFNRWIERPALRLPERRPQVFGRLGQEPC